MALLRNPIYTINVFASSSISLCASYFEMPYIAIAFCLFFIFFFDIENKGMREKSQGQENITVKSISD